MCGVVAAAQFQLEQLSFFFVEQDWRHFEVFSLLPYGDPSSATARGTYSTEREPRRHAVRSPPIPHDLSLTATQARERSVSRLRKPAVKVVKRNPPAPVATRTQTKWQRLKAKAGQHSPAVVVRKLQRSLSKNRQLSGRISPTSLAIDDVEEEDDDDDDDNEIESLAHCRVGFVDSDEEYASLDGAEDSYAGGQLTLKRFNEETFAEMDTQINEVLALRFRGSKWEAKRRAEEQRNIIVKLKTALREESQARRKFVDHASMHEERWSKELSFEKTSKKRHTAGIAAQHKTAMQTVEELQRELADEKAKRTVAQAIARESDARGSSTVEEASKMRMELDGLYSENRRLRAAKEDLEARAVAERERDASEAAAAAKAKAFEVAAQAKRDAEKQQLLDRALHIESKMAGMAAENKHMSAELGKKMERVALLEANLAASRGSSHDEATALRQRLEAERDALGAELAAERDSRAALDRELADHREQLSKAERVVAEKEMSELSSKSSSDRVQRQLDEARERLGESQQQNMDLQSKFMATQMELMQAKQGAMMAEGELVREKARAGDDAVRLKREQEEASAKAAESATLRVQLDEARGALDGKRAEMEAEQKNFLRRHDSWDDERSEMKTKCEVLAAEHSSLKEECATLQQECARLEEELEEKEASLTILKEAHARPMMTPRKKAAPGSPSASARVTDEQSEIDEQTEAAMFALRAELVEKQELIARHERTIAKLHEQLRQTADMGEAIAAKDAELAAVRGERRKLHNKLQELRGNIRVHVRVRPVLSGDRDRADAAGATVTEIVQVPTGESRICVLPNPAARIEGAVLGTERATETKSFEFNGVFPSTTSQAAVYNEMSALVQSAVDGFHVSLMAYGQTGSGKTHTMMGNDSDRSMRGLVPRAVSELLALVDGLRSRGWTYSIKTSFVEVYCEKGAWLSSLYAARACALFLRSSLSSSRFFVHSHQTRPPSLSLSLSLCAQSSTSSPSQCLAPRRESASTFRLSRKAAFPRCKARRVSILSRKRSWRHSCSRRRRCGRHPRPR